MSQSDQTAVLAKLEQITRILERLEDRVSALETGLLDEMGLAAIARDAREVKNRD